MPTYIPLGKTEKITFLVTDGAGDPKTGLTDVALTIHRSSDWQRWDFGTSAFAASPGSPTTNMSEVSAANQPGIYEYDWDMSSLTADDVYYLSADSATLTGGNLPMFGELRAGWTYAPTDVFANIGGSQVTLTIEDDATSDPINGVTIVVRNSTSDIVMVFGLTDSLGKYVFDIPDDTYKITVSKPGAYNFSSSPFTLVVSGTTTQTYQGTAFAPGSPGNPTLCRVFGYIKDITGTNEQDVKVIAELRVRGAWDTDVSPNVQIGDMVAEAVSDSNGYWLLDLLPNADIDPADTVYAFNFRDNDGKWEYKATVTVPDQTSVDFATLTKGAPEG